MRWATPSMLVVAVLMFLLPWVQVQCEPRGPQPFGGYTVLDQSGLQACWGGHSDLSTDMRFRGRMPGPPGNPFPKEALGVREEGAPLVIVFAVLLVLATGLGFAMPPGVARYSLVGTSLGLALIVLIVQTVIGFPLMNQLKQPGVLDRLGDQVLRDMGENPNTFMLTVRYAFGFYLTYAMLGAGVICLLVEIGNPPRPERERLRRDDDWDDEDDYEDERRRRRSRPPPRDGPRYDF